MFKPTLPLLLLLLVTARRTGAQPSPPSFYDGDDFNGYGSNFNATTAILVVVIVTVFFFLAFFSLYFGRCSRSRSTVIPTATAGAVTASWRGARGGLDPMVIETFPTLTYSAVAGLKIGKETLECAVCLSEFNDDETLRMLPRCCHVFHPECIDTWLQSHVTCPVCRDNLSVVPAEGSPEVGEGAGAGACGSEGVGGDATGRGSCDDVAIDLTRMGRSNTIGHHVTGGDRYTLRLPEHVRREIVAAGRLQRSASVVVFRAGGEGSSRRGFRGGGRSLSVGRLSERWTSGILGRVTTWRRGEADGSVVKKTGEGSTKKGGMFDCVGGGERGESSSNVDCDKTAVLDRV